MTKLISYIKPNCTSKDGTIQYLPAANICYIINVNTTKLKKDWSKLM
jgi:hypothetical protein